MKRVVLLCGFLVACGGGTASDIDAVSQAITIDFAPAWVEQYTGTGIGSHAAGSYTMTGLNPLLDHNGTIVTPAKTGVNTVTTYVGGNPGIVLSTSSSYAATVQSATLNSTLDTTWSGGDCEVTNFTITSWVSASRTMWTIGCGKLLGHQLVKARLKVIGTGSGTLGQFCQFPGNRAITAQYTLDSACATSQPCIDPVNGCTGADKGDGNGCVVPPGTC